jgi:F-type H+-transporting ATPase subunit gamma
MAQAREIKSRIKAVGNIERITSTMKMIATARFQASQRRALAAQPYTRKIRELVGELASATADPGSASEGGFTHPLLKAPQPATNRELLLVLTTNRGLCGSYNANVLRLAEQYRRSRGDARVDMEVVGKKGIAFFRFRQVPLAHAHTQFGDQPAFEDVEKLAGRYMDQFTAGEYDSVKIAYMAFESASRQSATIQQILPLEDPTQADAAATKSQTDYEYSPKPQELLGELLPASVKAQVFQAFNEAVVSEHVARMIAMSAATDNAKDMVKMLTRKYNRVRQASITTELTEIISGAAALG